MSRRVLTAKEQAQMFKPWLSLMAMKSIQPDMDVGRQVRKFDQRSQWARDRGDHELARYVDDMRDEMLRGVDRGEPQPFSQFWPMAEEEFGDRASTPGV